LIDSGYGLYGAIVEGAVSQSLTIKVIPQFDEMATTNKLRGCSILAIKIMLDTFSDETKRPDNQIHCNNQ
jgi:hypothetical protein